MARSEAALGGLTGISATTLSRAAGGQRLPPLDVLRGYVRDCRGDPEEWAPRWPPRGCPVWGVSYLVRARLWSRAMPSMAW